MAIASVPPKVEKSHIHENGKLLTEREINEAIQSFNNPNNQGNFSVKKESTSGIKYSVLKMGELENSRYFVKYLGNEGIQGKRVGGKALGQGAFGKVKLMQEITPGITSDWYALKIQNISTEYLYQGQAVQDENKKALVLAEYNKLAAVGHTPGGFLGVSNKKNQQQAIIGMKLAPGEEMYKVLVEKRPNVAKQDLLEIAVNTLNATAELHSKNFLHRDIKPENFIVDIATKQVSIIDLGLATHLPPNQPWLQEGVCGTAPYMAPEIKSGGYYSDRTEIYALGVTLGEILGLGTFEKINHNQNGLHDFRFNFQQPNGYNSMMSADLINYISSMMHPDPNRRPSLGDAKIFFQAQVKLLNEAKQNVSEATIVESPPEVKNVEILLAKKEELQKKAANIEQQLMDPNERKNIIKGCNKSKKTVDHISRSGR